VTIAVARAVGCWAAALRLMGSERTEKVAWAAAQGNSGRSPPPRQRPMSASEGG